MNTKVILPAGFSRSPQLGMGLCPSPIRQYPPFPFPWNLSRLGAVVALALVAAVSGLLVDDLEAGMAIYK